MNSKKNFLIPSARNYRNRQKSFELLIPRLQHDKTRRVINGRHKKRGGKEKGGQEEKRERKKEKRE